MARHFTIHHEDLVLQELLRQLEKRAGIRLQCFSDCKQLSELLDREAVSISALTLSRCFSISKSEHRPFVSTLNLLCIYLGFRSFSHFCTETNDFIKYALTYPHLHAGIGDYSYAALELAIKVGDWQTTRLILESFDQKESNILDFVQFLGKQARNHVEKNQLLALFADTETGRHFFYEWFVDEDDPDGYYTQALKTHYNPSKKSLGEQLFYHAFVNSKRIYKGFSVDKKKLLFFTDKSINPSELHYHQISRLFEMRILNEFLGMNRLTEIEKIIDELISQIANRFWQDENWVLMRSVKALVFSGHFNNIIQHHNGLKKQLEKQFEISEGKMNSSADLALQLIVHATKELNFLIQLPPTRLQFPAFNDQKECFTYESATALLYAKPPICQSMTKNLRKFTANNEQSWVMNLLKK